MTWIRHQATRGSGRSTLLLSSVLALLALACFPILAQADSSEIEYENALPKAEGNGPSHNEQIAESSDSLKNGGAEAPANTGSGSGEGSYTNAQSSEGGGAGTTGNDGGTGQGNPGKGTSPSGKAGVQPAAPIAKSGAASDDGGGSSPLVPILIAVLALAAISIAAVMIRQRRQRDGSGPSSLSTKAG
jgi:hypothetical protein